MKLIAFLMLASFSCLYAGGDLEHVEHEKFIRVENWLKVLPDGTTENSDNARVGSTSPVSVVAVAVRGRLKRSPKSYDLFKDLTGESGRLPTVATLKPGYK